MSIEERKVGAGVKGLLHWDEYIMALWFLLRKSKRFERAPRCLGHAWLAGWEFKGNGILVKYIFTPFL